MRHSQAEEQEYPESVPAPPVSSGEWVADDRGSANEDQEYPESQPAELVQERKCPLCGKDY